jgi:hypothetical protein
MSLAALDTLIVNRIALRELVNFDFAGVTWVASAGSRDTMKSLTQGGFTRDQEVSLLVPCDQFIEAQTTPPTEQGTITLHINDAGIPCDKDSASNTTPTVSARITRISRSGGAYTYELRTAKR